MLFFKKGREVIVDDIEEKFPLLFDIRLQAPRNLWLDSNFAQVETDANILLRGSNKNPSILGRINLLNGFISLEEIGLKYTNFKIQEGLIDFINPTVINPFCDISCSATIDDVLVWRPCCHDKWSYRPGKHACDRI